MCEVYLAHRTARDFEQRVALERRRAEAADHGETFLRERKLLDLILHAGEYADEPLTQEDAPAMSSVEAQTVPGEMHDPAVAPPESETPTPTAG